MGNIEALVPDNPAALPTGGEHKKNGSITLKLSLIVQKSTLRTPWYQLCPGRGAKPSPGEIWVYV